MEVRHRQPGAPNLRVAAGGPQLHHLVPRHLARLAGIERSRLEVVDQLGDLLVARHLVFPHPNLAVEDRAAQDRRALVLLARGRGDNPVAADGLLVVGHHRVEQGRGQARRRGEDAASQAGAIPEQRAAGQLREHLKGG